MTTDDKDLLGTPLDADERELLDLYRRLCRMAERQDLAPCITANVKQAMVLVWNACADLDLVADPPDAD